MEITVAEQPGINMKIPNLTIEQLLEAGVHLRPQNFKMESKNEKIYFWKKRLCSYN